MLYFLSHTGAIMKQVGFFTLGAVVPATLCIAFSTMILNHCDGKFGCAGTFNLLFKFSVLPIAFISSLILIIAMYFVGISVRYKPWILIFFGALVSLFNLYSFKMAEGYGFTTTTVVIAVTTALSFIGLSRLNITKVLKTDVTEEQAPTA